MNKRHNRKLRKLFPAWNFIEYAFVRTVMVLINSFPIAVSTWLARKLGEVLFLLMPKRRRIARENIGIVFGDSRSDAEKRRLALESFRHLATCLMEFFRLPKFVKVSERYVRFRGTEHLDRAFARGKGLILVMSHLGPWEYLAFLGYLKGYPCAVLGRPVKNPHLYQWIKSLRKTMKANYIDKDMGAREIFSELRQNHLVAIAIDQWAGNEGLWIDFFGIPTSTTSLPARLVKRTGCAIIPAYCIRVASGKYEVRIHPELSLKEKGNNWIEGMTEELNCLLEEQIRVFPNQWLWVHKRWKGKKNGEDKTDLPIFRK